MATQAPLMAIDLESTKARAQSLIALSVPQDFVRAYSTSRGVAYCGRAEHVLTSPFGRELRGRVQLLFTSPPFPLNRQKRYKNETGEAYIEWLASFAPLFRDLLTPNGSIVLEMGNAWEGGKPVMSTLALRALLEFLNRGNLYLCQQFICYNPARLPSPAQWVNVKRCRLKDAYTHVWWMSPVPEPEADNRRVLKPYSPSMRRLLANKKYNAGPRPSEHHIGKTSFFTDNGGAIPPNVICCRNTTATSPYQKYCREHGLKAHPARMSSELAEFFVKFLTKPRNLVVDPFAGSNTTGAAAENLKRRWMSIEAEEKYLLGSRGRFQAENLRIDSPA